MLDVSCVEELVDLVRSHTHEQGRTASALPGVWLFRYDRPQPLCRKRSSSMYVGLAVQGRKLLRTGGLELVYDPLSYLVLRGETEYEAQTIVASPARPYLAIGLSLSPQLVTQALLEIADAGHTLDDAGDEAPPAFVAPLDAALIDGMGRLLRTLGDPLERRVLAPLVIRELVFRLLLTNAAAVFRQVALQQGERERIRQAMAYIDAHAEERLTVEGIARRVAMSPSHFAHRFRAIASVSPMRYQKHVRMERARELLLAGKRASAIASQLGYASDAHFTRDFKRHFGLAPASYVRAFGRDGTALVRSVEPAGGVLEGPFAGSSKNNAGPAMGAADASR